MIAVLPWAHTDEVVDCGDFEIIPYGVAVATGTIPADHVAATDAVLESFGKVRKVDRDHTPILRHKSLDAFAELTEQQTAEYFGFRERLAFAALAKREFFGHRYANSDNVKLYIHGYTTASGGAAVVTTRRRDGSTKNFRLKGTFKVERPDHVSSSFDLSCDVDMPLLTALEESSACGDALWEKLSDAIHLFVGASTDSSDISDHSELIDLVSAFSRLGGAWVERDTVSGFVNALPADDWANSRFGPRAEKESVKAALQAGKPMRTIWLGEAYKLRGKVGHGDVANTGLPKAWTMREHLLLASIALPLYVKALLREALLYQFSDLDDARNIAFDALATLTPFEIENDMATWREIISSAGMRKLSQAFWDAMQAERKISAEEP